MVLYGLGVTIGAGIYVLIGAATERAGVYAPVSFFLAAVIIGFSAASFAEFAGRFPVSAGEAAYVRAGFNSKLLSLVVGILVVASGVISSATISRGSVGYLQEFFALPGWTLICTVVLVLGIIAAWGIMESVIFASLFTLVEVSALLIIIGAGLAENEDLFQRVPSTIPHFGDIVAWGSVASAGLLAFFAFIGFEDMVNLAEEVKNPRRVLPWAIFLTLVLGTAIYFMVTAVAVLSVPLEQLAQSRAPLSFVFGHLTGASSAAISCIAIVATLNGVIIQIIMASRVLYGLGKQGALPKAFARISAITRTPLISTFFVTTLVLLLALTFPLEGLAEMTSRIVLIIFALVNLALIRLKLRRNEAATGAFSVRIWRPICGEISCVALLVYDAVA